MKTRIFQKTLAIAAAGSLALLALNASAQNSTGANAAPQMPSSVTEIMQLTQAKVSDDTIIAYIKNSGNGYSLNAAQIIYLHQHGISDAVINAMINQPKLAGASATVATSNASAPPPAALSASASTAKTTPLYSPRQKGEMANAPANTSTAATSTATVAPRRQQFVHAPSLIASQPGLDSQDSNLCYHADFFCGHYSAAKDLSGLAKEIDFICRALCSLTAGAAGLWFRERMAESAVQRHKSGPPRWRRGQSCPAP